MALVVLTATTARITMIRATTVKTTVCRATTKKDHDLLSGAS
jgi:hypothetical protein